MDTLPALVSHHTQSEIHVVLQGFGCTISDSLVKHMGGPEFLYIGSHSAGHTGSVHNLVVNSELYLPTGTPTKRRIVSVQPNQCFTFVHIYSDDQHSKLARCALQGP